MSRALALVQTAPSLAVTLRSVKTNSSAISKKKKKKTAARG